MTVTWNGESIQTTRIYAGEYLAQNENLDICQDRECPCMGQRRNHTEFGVSEMDAAINLVQWYYDNPDIADFPEYREPWNQCKEADNAGDV